MKLWTLTTLCTASLLILSGCGASPKPQDKALIDETLPVVTLTKNGVYADINAIAFEWKSIQDPRVEGIYVYKKSPAVDGVQKGHIYFDTIDNRFATHYVDNDIEANSDYSYAFKTFSKGAESQLTKAVNVKSLPTLSSVAWIHSINGMPRTAKIIWRPHSNQKVKSYIIERKVQGEKVFSEIDRVDGRLNVEYIDTGLKDNMVYQYRVKVETFDKLISAPSQSVTAITKALPNSVQSVRASLDMPKEIHIAWAPSSIKGFSHYHLYKSESRDDDFKLIAKLKRNTHIDKVDEDQKSYYYRVSAVDIDGLESKNENTTVQGRTLGKPKSPVSVEAIVLGAKIELTWSNTDNRTKKFIVMKKEKSGWLSEKTSKHTIKGEQRFQDFDLKPGATYIYNVYAVDANGIVSEASSAAKIKLPESKKIIAPKKVEQKESVVLPVETIEVQGETVIPNKDLKLNEI